MITNNDFFWDFDSTIVYSIFDMDYERFIGTKRGVALFKKFMVLNPIVNPKDVKHVITARSTFNNHNDIHKDLQNFGLKVDSLHLNDDIKLDHAKIIKFKSNVLNHYKPKYYVDDDDFFNIKLRPHLTHTQCITTEQYKMLKDKKRFIF